MSFPILVARNNSETIAITKNLTSLFELNGVLKDGCSIIDPVIEVETNVDAFTGANYLIIPSFGRRYFIRDVVSTYYNLTEISCHVDVLSSFADAIKSNRGIVHRQERNWNLYLDDGVLKAYQNPLINTITFPQGFSGHTNLLLLAGRHGGGASYGADVGGAGDVNSKTTAGLINYASSQLGRPYWYGTFGNTASQALYDAKKIQYPTYYTATDFPQQFGQRVHDCVGLIKGYRWSETPDSDPVYNPTEDVDVKGLFAQCVIDYGVIADTPGLITGCVVFTNALDHCGIYIGNGEVIEARGHAYGVVTSTLANRNFTLWGIPMWMQVTT